MATTKKKSPVSSPKARRGDYGSSYVRLRTVLDAMELAALRFYLSGKTAAEREQAAKKIVPMVMDMINILTEDFSEGCPRGYNNCGGCCVPYPCPSDF